LAVFLEFQRKILLTYLVILFAAPCIEGEHFC